MTIRGRIINPLERSYYEASLFAISLTVSLLYSANATFRHYVNRFFSSERDVRLIFLWVVAVSGLLLPFYHVFSAKQKSYATSANKAFRRVFCPAREAE